MTRYLLDADAAIDFFNGVIPSMALIEVLYGQGDNLCTCDIVAAEVHAGLLPEERSRGHALLSSMSFLATSLDASRQAGLWRYDFARLGQQLSTTDCLIAAIAHEHGATLLTGNTRHYPMEEVRRLALPRPGTRPR